MSFPSSPSNGQTAVVNGISYVYSSAKSAWNRINSVTANSISVTGNVNIFGNLAFGTTTANASFDASTVTGGIILPSGTTAQRPANSKLGTIRYNTTFSVLEIYTNTGWTQLISATTPTISNIQFSTGGTINFTQNAFSSIPQQITITGTNFTAPMSVLINGVTAANTVSNATQIVATIAGTFSYGNLPVVVAPGLSGTTTMTFSQVPIWATIGNLIFPYATPVNYGLTNNLTLASGDTVAYTVSSGSLPTNVSIVNGAIVGTPVGYTSNIASTIGITATNRYGLSATQTIPYYLVGATTPIWNSAAIAAAGNVTVTQFLPSTTVLSQYVSYSIGDTITYTVASGSVPTGMVLTSTGNLTGTPTGYAGTTSSNFVVTATDREGQSANQTFNYTVVTYSVSLTSNLTTGPNTTGAYFNQLFTANGNVGAVSWSNIGSLPTGLTLTPTGNTATVAGYPTTAGTYSYTIKVVDTNNVSNTLPYSGTIATATSYSATVFIVGAGGCGGSAPGSNEGGGGGGGGGVGYGTVPISTGYVGTITVGGGGGSSSTFALANGPSYPNLVTGTANGAAGGYGGNGGGANCAPHLRAGGGAGTGGSGAPFTWVNGYACLLYTSPSPRDRTRSRMPSSA